jgi:hypothetical protein
MSLKTIAVSLPLLWRSATAFPAGPGFFPNGSTPSAMGEVSISAAYSLIDSYDASNWVSKFDVQDIADPTRMLLPHLKGPLVLTHIGQMASLTMLVLQKLSSWVS